MVRLQAASCAYEGHRGGGSFIAREVDVLFILLPETHEQTHLAPTQKSCLSAMAEQMNETPATEAKTLEIALEAVMVKSRPVPAGTPIVKGYDFNKGRDLDGIMACLLYTSPSPRDS